MSNYFGFYVTEKSTKTVGVYAGSKSEALEKVSHLINDGEILFDDGHTEYDIVEYDGDAEKEGVVSYNDNPNDTTYGFSFFADIPDEKWDGVSDMTDEVLRAEKNFLVAMRGVKGVTMIRDEGHDSYDELIGTIIVSSESEAEKMIQDVIDGEPLRSTSGTIPHDILSKIEDGIGTSLEFSINFYK